MPIYISPPLVLSTPATVGADVGRIGYINYLEDTDTTITASSEAAGWPVESLQNALTFERWKPVSLNAVVYITFASARDINYCGLSAHTFGTNGNNITLQYSLDNATWTTVETIIPADNKPIMWVFETIFAKYWRFQVWGTNVPSLGVLYLGETLNLPNKIYGGHTPITLGRKSRAIRNKTEGGQFAGISLIREGVANTVTLRHLEPDWYREYFDPFVRAARTKPFFYSWRPDSYPLEAGYCWAIDDITPSNMGLYNYMECSLTLEGYSDE